jgi:hypothetical protein
MLLDMRKAQLAELQLRREMGSLVDLADVTARRQADAEVIQADLLHVLPAAVSGHAGALGCDAARLRDIVRTEVKKIMEEIESIGHGRVFREGRSIKIETITTNT